MPVVRLAGGPFHSERRTISARLGIDEDGSLTLCVSGDDVHPLPWLNAVIAQAADGAAQARRIARRYRAELYRPAHQRGTRRATHVHAGSHLLRVVERPSRWSVERGLPLADGVVLARAPADLGAGWDALLAELEDVADRVHRILSLPRGELISPPPPGIAEAVVSLVDEGRRLARIGSTVQPGFRPGNATRLAQDVADAMHALVEAAEAALSEAVHLQLSVPDRSPRVVEDAARGLRAAAEAWDELHGL